MKKIWKKIVDFIKRLFGIKPNDKPEETSEETKDLINVGPSVYIEQDNLQKNQVQGIVYDIGKWALTTLINTTGSKSAAMLFDYLFTSKESGEMKEVMDKLNEIEDQLKNLITLYHNTTYETYINQRSTLISDLYTGQNECITRLSTEFKKSAEERDNNKIKEVIDKWANSNISGNQAVHQFKNVINVIINSRIEQATLYDVYDTYVYNTTAWESQGYDFRETLRNVDISIITMNALMSALHYTLRDDLTETEQNSLIKDIKDVYERYVNYYNNHKVVRHNDLAICQIQGLHFKMPIKLEYKDYKNNMYWFTPGTEWTDNSAKKIVYGPDVDNTFSHSLTIDEYNKLVSFYNGKYSSMVDVLKNEAGITNPVSDFDGHCVLIIQADTYQMPVSGAYKYFATGLRCAGDIKTLNKVTPNWGICSIGWAKTEETGFLFWTKQKFVGWGSDNDIPSDQRTHYGAIGGKWYAMNVTRY